MSSKCPAAHPAIEMRVTVAPLECAAAVVPPTPRAVDVQELVPCPDVICIHSLSILTVYVPLDGNPAADATVNVTGALPSGIAAVSVVVVVVVVARPSIVRPSPWLN